MPTQGGIANGSLSPCSSTPMGSGERALQRPPLRLLRRGCDARSEGNSAAGSLGLAALNSYDTREGGSCRRLQLGFASIANWASGRGLNRANLVLGKWGSINSS